MLNSSSAHDAKAPNPFRPGITVDPRYFAGRKRQIELFRQYLHHASAGNPQNIAVMGERGIGKSSLLRKFETIARDAGSMVVRRDLDPTLKNVEALVAFLLESIRHEGMSYFSRKGRAEMKVREFFEKYTVSPAIQTPVLGGGIAVARQTVPLMQEYFHEELVRVWKKVQQKLSCIVLLLDEGEVLTTIEGSWSFLRSVFGRVFESGAHYMLVVAGKLGLFKGIKEIHSPMERFFIPMELGPLTLEETAEALRLPIEDVGVSIEEEAVKQVDSHSEGHPFVIQVFGFHLFERCEKIIDLPLVESVLPAVLSRLASQVFRDRYGVASEQEKFVLRKMARIPENTIRLSQVAKATGIGNPGQILDRLVQKDCLVKVGRGTYSFSHPLFRLYVRQQS